MSLRDKLLDRRAELKELMEEYLEQLKFEKSKSKRKQLRREAGKLKETIMAIEEFIFDLDCVI